MRFASLNTLEFADFYLKHTVTEVAEHYSVHVKSIESWRARLKLPRKIGLWRDGNLPFLTSYQGDILVGSMLGDGSLDKISKYGDSRYMECHSEKQSDWLAWKRKIFQPFSRKIVHKTVKGRKRSVNKVTDCPEHTYEQCSFRTFKHPIFTKFEKDWYLRNSNGDYVYKDKRRIKCLPVKLQLNPTIVAVWFLDDGYNAKNRATLCSDAFSVVEVNYLKDELHRLGILDCSIDRCNRIRIKSKSFVDFIDIVKHGLADIPVSMLYKLDVPTNPQPDVNTP